MKNVIEPKPFTPIFDANSLNNDRLEGESFEAYKIRRSQNNKFMKMYLRYGRERFEQVLEFMKMMGENGVDEQ
jgi:hypothetical protein